ncbi:excisionase family protein [Pseudocalidococcus azoricus]|uniref:excisionase family protein n=1 Tax=Pseudocalidococcus azoricus TaxID=3110322 RepID=UPI003899C0B7
MVAEKLGISEGTAKNYRLRGIWIQGIHYQALGDRNCWRAKTGRGPRKILYHLENCQHWLQTRHEPELHEKFCLQYQESLMGGGP